MPQTSRAQDIRSLPEELRTLQSKYSETLSKDEALKYALESAELHMKFLRLATNKSEKTELREKCKSLLDEAERIKGSEEWSVNGELLIDVGDPMPLPSTTSEDSAPSIPSRALPPGDGQWFDQIDVLSSEPVSTRALSDQEKSILSQSSKINGLVFPAFTESPKSVAPEHVNTGEPYKDPTKLKMSADQLAILDDWKRPEYALPPPFWLENNPKARLEERTDRATKDVQFTDLVQDAATDCSIVASLSAGIARAERGFPDILSTAIHPFDADAKQPLISLSGKYTVRLNFNGCHRQVTIDDRLPVSKSSRILHVLDRNNPTLLWPALLEKAYLKMRGGYDFPGSNSGTDLWVLTGWIPEHKFLQSRYTDADKLWPRVFKAFGYGDVLVTLGTGVMTPESEDDLGLAGKHDYAIIDMGESNGQKRMLIKNPWLEGTTWKGHHAASEQPDSQTNSNTLGDGNVQLAAPMPPAESGSGAHTRNLAPGMFWMDVDNVMQNFESVYLNWNPSLFKHRQDIHFSWNLTPGLGSGRSCPDSFTNNPQFTVKSTKEGSIWLLLSKHFLSNSTAIARERPEEFISLYAFDNGGTRCFLRRKFMEKTLYADSPQTLMILDAAEANKTYTVVISEQKLQAVTHSFTLSAFSRGPLSLDVAPSRHPRQAIIHSAWNHGNCGGNSSSPRYSQNPQFEVTLSASSTICIMLETAAPGLRVHAKLLHGEGQRVFAVTNRDVIVDTDSYRKGCAYAETKDEIPAGKYTLICSTFEAGQDGEFTLRVTSNAKTTIAPIAREGAGRIRQSLAEASFAYGVRAVATPVSPKRLAMVNFAARYVQGLAGSTTNSNGRALNPAANSPLRLTLEYGRGPERQILIASGNGSLQDASSGIRTEDITLNPEMNKDRDVWLVLERIALFDTVNRPEERVSVDMFADVADPASFGVWRDWDR